MKLIVRSFLCMGLLTLAAHNAHAQTVTKATVNFHSTSDGKDGDSQVRDQVVCGGVTVLELYCCSAGKRSQGDIWDKNSNQSRDMKIDSPVAKSAIPGCVFIAGMSPVGNDTWNAIYSIDLTFSDGSHLHYDFGEIDLPGTNSTYIEKRANFNSAAVH
jgi:hypothetical protein